MLPALFIFLSHRSSNIFIGVTHMQLSLQHMPDTWEIHIEKINKIVPALQERIV